MLGLLWLAGCSQSLFDAHVPLTCGASCIADAAADFDATAAGTNEHDWRWRYLDDHRDRSWAPMKPSANLDELTGADPGNHITTCATHPDAPACIALPGALLVSSAGSDSAADPAIELTAAASTAIQLSVHAFVPRGDAQTIRIYRNSREDVLFTGTATAGAGFQHTITLDAVGGDRFLVAIEPTGQGATDVGLQVLARGTGATFPSTCQLSLPFTTAIAPENVGTNDRCRDGTFTFFHYPSQATPEKTTILTDKDGPFPELAPAAGIPGEAFFQGDHALDWSDDVTVQLWIRRSAGVPMGTAWLFSDLDPVACDGIAIAITPAGNLEVTACTDPNTGKRASMATASPVIDDRWKLVRVVRTSDKVRVCVDGAFQTSFTASTNRSPGLTTQTPPYLGKEDATPSDTYLDGAIDDVRVITGALPCDAPP